MMIFAYTVDSRYSGSLKYGHLDIPAIGLARNASYMFKYGHSLFCLPASAGGPKQGFQCNFIRILRPDMTFWVWFSLDYT